MGYTQEQLTITAWLSSHNDDRDEADARAWESLCQQVQALIDAPEYRDIRPML
jgi:hypothetical protein